MMDLERMKQLAGMINESEEQIEEQHLGEAPHGNYEEQQLIKMIEDIRNMSNRIARLAGNAGPMDILIQEIGGDSSYLADLLQAAEDLHRAADEVDYGARSHLSGE